MLCENKLHCRHLRAYKCSQQKSFSDLEQIQKLLEGSHIQSSGYQKQCTNHILGSCKHPKLVFCFCSLSNDKYEQQDMCSWYALIISHGDSVTNLLYITFHLFKNLSVLMITKILKSQVIKKKSPCMYRYALHRTVSFNYFCSSLS